MPSLATSGSVYVVPPGESLSSPGTAAAPFSVDSYRNVNGFSFENSNDFQNRVGGYSFRRRVGRLRRRRDARLGEPMLAVRRLLDNDADPGSVCAPVLGCRQLCATRRSMLRFRTRQPAAAARRSAAPGLSGAARARRVVRLEPPGTRCREWLIGRVGRGRSFRPPHAHGAVQRGGPALLVGPCGPERARGQSGVDHE